MPPRRSSDTTLSQSQSPRAADSVAVGAGARVSAGAAGACPGLAIMVAQLKDGRAWFKIPYEFLPRPQKGELWDAAGRDGTVLGTAKIEAVVLSPKTRTPVVTVSTEKDLMHLFATVVRPCTTTK